MIATLFAVIGFFSVSIAILLYALQRKSLLLYTSGVLFITTGIIRLWVWLTNAEARILTFSVFSLAVTCLLIRMVLLAKKNGKL